MYIQKIHLHNFRNHKNISLEFINGPSVLFGLNGSGKTNILEAISLFTVGKGLRNASYDDMGSHSQDPKIWNIHLQLQDSNFPHIDYSIQYRDKKRLNHIQGTPIQSSKLFSDWVTLFWLTCEHDRLFVDASKARRKFLDRMVFNIDTQHAYHLVSYEKLFKERLNLLEKSNHHSAWLDSIEKQMAEYALKITQSRKHIIQQINSETSELDPIFPQFTSSLSGEIETFIEANSNLSQENLIHLAKEKWMQSRHLDQQRHMTHFGVHRTDFNVFHHEKGDAHQCSTGEQKILLMGLVLSFLSFRMKTDERLILVLLDECLSHFDFRHRMVLFKQIEKFYQSDKYLGSMHAFMTGTDRAAFEPLESFASFHEIGKADRE